MRIVAAAAALILIELSGPAKSSAQPPDLDLLVRRVGAYVQQFIEDFSNVVSEEDYEQRYVNGARRRLRSEFLLVGYPGNAQYVLTFRDVREVDGRPLADKEERITRLFLQPFDSAVKRAQEIHREGLTHSLAGTRLMDPLVVIGYLQPVYQKSFRVARGGLERSLGPDIREITLTQTRPPGGQPDRARAWVSEATGEVVKTELRAGTRITTMLFGVDAGLRIRVPTEMRDSVRLFNSEYVATAKYTNFRRFQVRAESVVDVPASPSPQ